MSPDLFLKNYLATLGNYLWYRIIVPYWQIEVGIILAVLLIFLLVRAGPWAENKKEEMEKELGTKK